MKLTSEEVSKRYRHSITGKINQIYYNQRGSSKRRNHKMPTYTKDEFEKWLLEETIFMELFKLWELSDYSRFTAPSVDRIDDTVGYTMKNIQVMTWQENKDKAHRDRASGKLKVSYNSKGNPKGRPALAVVQLTMQGLVIKDYPSIREAAKSTSTLECNISRCCNEGAKSAGGFIWKHK